jgi:hypothetical protein
MKLADLKTATRGMKLPNTLRVEQVGGIAYRMGIERNANPHRLPLLNEVWAKGWDAAKRKFEDMLRRNGCDGVRSKLGTS